LALRWGGHWEGFWEVGFSIDVRLLCLVIQNLLILDSTSVWCKAGRCPAIAIAWHSTFMTPGDLQISDLRLLSLPNFDRRQNEILMLSSTRVWCKAGRCSANAVTQPSTTIAPVQRPGLGSLLNSGLRLLLLLTFDRR
jgi:hypothetical protein